MVLVNRNGSKKEGMMKKILSIFLVFSLFIQQPAYSIAQASEPQKKGVIARAKATFSAMKEAMSRGRAMLKANSQCLLLGKGKDCTPEKRGMLLVIRDFTLGRFKKASSGIKAAIKLNLGCFVALLTFVGVPVTATVTSVEAGIKALATSKEKMAKFKEVWSDWNKRREKGMRGGGLLPEFMEKWERQVHPRHGKSPLLIQCTFYFMAEISVIIMIAMGIFTISPAGRRFSRENEVKKKMTTDLFNTMQQQMETFSRDTTAEEVIDALVEIFNQKKKKWPDTYKAFLKEHNLIGLEYDDPKLEIATFDQLGINKFSNIQGIVPKSLIRLALLPGLIIFPLGKYDEKRLEIIEMLKTKDVSPDSSERQSIHELKVGLRAINKAKELGSASQALLDDIAERAVRDYRREVRRYQ